MRGPAGRRSKYGGAPEKAVKSTTSSSARRRGAATLNPPFPALGPVGRQGVGARLRPDALHGSRHLVSPIRSARRSTTRRSPRRSSRSLNQHRPANRNRHCRTPMPRDPYASLAYRSDAIGSERQHRAPPAKSSGARRRLPGKRRGRWPKQPRQRSRRRRRARGRRPPPCARESQASTSPE